MTFEGLRKWREGKPLALLLYAEQAVAAADGLFGLLKAIRRGKGLPWLAGPPAVSAWLRLYRSHHRLQDALGPFVGFGASGAGSASGKAAEWRQIVKSRAEETASRVVSEKIQDPDRIKQLIGEAGKYLLNRCLEMLPRAAGDGLPADDDAVGRMTEMPELQFFVRVWFPCWMEYRVYPTELLWRARKGDLDALEDLLRLDKSVVHDRLIAEHIHQTWHAEGRGEFQRIGAAFFGAPRKGISARRVKYALAGLISEYARQLKQPVTEPEIRGLFDAYAKAQGKLRDTDLAESPESFSMAIRRERRKWSIPRWPDKTKS
jgi:hypothetical protein